jgi:ABC-2 type transport system permease protein
VIGWLGEILELPSWAMDLSPLTHTPQVPLEDVTAGPLLALVAVAALLVAVGAVGLRRRDVVTE